MTQDNESGSAGQKGFWASRRGRFTLGGLLSVALAAAAGFLSPEVRRAACLELPKPEDLVYPQADGAVPYRDLGVQSLQPSFDGREIRFAARVYGEMQRAAYQGVQSPQYDGHAIASIGSVDEKDADGPFGRPMPPVAVLLSPELARQWAGVPLGAAVLIEGKAQFLADFPADSPTGRQLAGLRQLGQDLSMVRIPDHADFWVVASKITPLRALNDPRDRLMCKWRRLPG